MLPKLLGYLPKGRGSKRNSYKQGTLRFFVYFDQEENEFVGACLDLSIVVQDKDIDALKKRLEKAAEAYVINVVKNQLSADLLNQQPPKEIRRKYDEFRKYFDQKSVSKSDEFQRADLYTTPLFA